MSNFRRKVCVTQVCIGRSGFEEGLIPIPCGDAQLKASFDLLLDTASRERLGATICEAAKRQRIAIETMWTEVFRVLQTT